MRNFRRWLLRVTVCRWRGHAFYRIVSDESSPLAALLPVDECQRCGHWETKPKSVLLGIERNPVAWWRNKRDGD